MADYNTENLKAKRPGQTTEDSDSGRLPAGLYEHVSAVEADGKPIRMFVQVDPLYGDGQARAAERAGFVYKRPAKPGELKTVVDAPSIDPTSSRQEDQPNDAATKGLEARMALLEAQNAQLQAQLATKQSAADNVASQTGVAIDPATGEIVPPEVPQPETLKGKNETELRAIAEAESVELTEEQNTKKLIREAIEAKRAESEN